MKTEILKSLNNIKKVVGYLNKFEYIAVDTETTGLGRFAKIIGISFSATKDEGFYIPFFESTTLDPFWNKEDKKDICNIINKLLVAPNKKLIYHNAQFDIIRLKSDLGVDGESNLFFDTKAAKHILEEDHMRCRHGLKECGDYYLGVPPDDQKALKESVKKNGGTWKIKEKDFYKADLDILGKYACMDTNLTLQLFYKFYSMIKEEQLTDLFFKEVMPLVKVTIEMESVGIEIDVDYCKNMKQYLEEEIDRTDTEIYDEIQEKHPKAIARVEKDLLDGKYSINCNPKFYKCLMTSIGIELPTNKDGKVTLAKKELEKLGTHPLILWRLGERSLEDIWDEFEDDLILTQKNLYFQDNPEEKRVLNLNSPKQLADFLYNKLGETPIRYTDGGGGSADKLVFYHFREKYPFFGKLIIRNSMHKALTSYINRFLELNVDGRFYPNFNMTKVVTGRYASDFQQLPRVRDKSGFDQGSLVKQAVVAKKDHILVASDYPQLEIRIMAALANEPVLLKAFKEGLDSYGTMAVDIFDLDCHPNDVEKLYLEKRNLTKIIVLGTNYGKGPYKLAVEMGLNKDDFGYEKEFKEVFRAGKEALDNYFKKFKKIKLFQNQCKSLAIHGGYVKTLTGRKRRLPEIKQYYKQKDKKSRGIFGALMRQAINFPIQGLAASITNRAMIIFKELRDKHNIDAKIICQIHDEIVLEAKKEDAKKAAKLLKWSMENAFNLGVALPVEPVLGKNWAEIK